MYMSEIICQVAFDKRIRQLQLTRKMNNNDMEEVPHNETPYNQIWLQNTGKYRLKKNLCQKNCMKGIFDKSKYFNSVNNPYKMNFAETVGALANTRIKNGETIFVHREIDPQFGTIKGSGGLPPRNFP